ncbi:hypothetical protein [Brevibacillus composti]|uniref:hypothetical protein n=1 Tax=Brevibacillus composti TaxID=2796470 RepID=UPI001E4D049D
MAKRKRQITGAKIEKFIKQGRGQGVGKDYLPWLEMQLVKLPFSFFQFLYNNCHYNLVLKYSICMW